jgi:hypothetical protein
VYTFTIGVPVKQKSTTVKVVTKKKSKTFKKMMKKNLEIPEMIAIWFFLFSILGSLASIVIVFFYPLIGLWLAIGAIFVGLTFLALDSKLSVTKWAALRVLLEIVSVLCFVFSLATIIAFFFVK